MLPNGDPLMSIVPGFVFRRMFFDIITGNILTSVKLSQTELYHKITAPASSCLAGMLFYFIVMKPGRGYYNSLGGGDIILSGSGLHTIS